MLVFRRRLEPNARKRFFSYTATLIPAFPGALCLPLLCGVLQSGEWFYVVLFTFLLFCGCVQAFDFELVIC